MTVQVVTPKGSADRHVKTSWAKMWTLQFVQAGPHSGLQLFEDVRSGLHGVEGSYREQHRGCATVSCRLEVVCRGSQMLLARLVFTSRTCDPPPCKTKVVALMAATFDVRADRQHVLADSCACPRYIVVAGGAETLGVFTFPLPLLIAHFELVFLCNPKQCT